MSATDAPGRPTLVLVPTPLETRRLADLGGLGPGLGLVELCGFGPVAAAARAGALLERLRPRRVLLLGIAGAYDESEHPPGTALAFERVAVEGIGAGEGDDLVPPARLGFPQWPGPGTGGEAADVLPLCRPAGTPAGELGLLLTTCAASADEPQAALRRRRHPEALAEDMEGFGVALACAQAGVPLAVVRGISNRVGVRDPARWRIPAALAAARELALELLSSPEPWETPS
jgi:futalosine hydrolase